MGTELLGIFFFFLSSWQGWRIEATSRVGIAGGGKQNGRCLALVEKDPLMQTEAWMK